MLPLPNLGHPQLARRQNSPPHTRNGKPTPGIFFCKYSSSFVPFDEKVNINVILALFLPLLLLVFVNSSLVASCSGDSLLLEEGINLKKAAEYEAAVKKLSEAQACFLKNANPQGYSDAVYHKALSYNSLRQVSAAIQETKSWMEAPLFQQLKPFDQKCRIYNLLGYLLGRTEAFDEALELYEAVLQESQAKNAYPPQTIYALWAGANICIRKLEYERALSFLRIAEAKDVTGSRIPSIKTSILMSLHYLGEQQAAIQYYDEMLTLNLPPGQKIHLEEIGQELFLETGQLNRANQAASWLRDYYLAEADSLNLASPLAILAQIALKKGNQQQAARIYNQGVQLLQKHTQSKSRENAKYYANAGLFFERLDSLDKAIHLYQLALTEVFPNFNDGSIYAFPQYQQLPAESWIMTSARRKGSALQQRYLSTKNPKDLRAAVQSFQLFWDALEVIRQTYTTDQSKIHLGQYLQQDIEAAITVYHQLAQIENQQEYYREILQCMERSKAVALTDAILQNKAFALAAIPDSLLLKEQQLRRQLATARDALFQVPVHNPTSASLQQKVDSLQQVHYLFTKNLAERFPTYQVPKEITPDVLTENDRYLVEFFWGPNQVIALTSYQGELAVHPLGESAALQEQLQALLEYFKGPQAIENQPMEFAALSAGLYETLLFFLPKDLQEQPLLIIPDGPLHFLPFEALLPSKPANNRLDQWPYLLHNWQISYDYSLSTFQQKQTLEAESKTHNKALGFAPGFEEGTRGLAPLPYSAIESSYLQLLRPEAQLFLGQRATVEQFIQQAALAEFIHLSTHAHGDEDQLPQIEFADQALRLEQLYGLRIPARLVVLSACQTNLGRLAAGEGVMSLARGFFYAGANSLLASLWAVNESSTNQLMEGFYQKLAKGKTAITALQEAKRSYLQDPEISMVRKSPYYWAGFVYLGADYKPHSGRFPFLWWAVGLGLLSMFAGVFIIRRRPK